MPSTPYTRQSPEQRELGRLRDLLRLRYRQGKALGEAMCALVPECMEIEKRLAELEKEEADEEQENH